MASLENKLLIAPKEPLGSQNQTSTGTTPPTEEATDRTSAAVLGAQIGPDLGMRSRPTSIVLDGSEVTIQAFTTSDPVLATILGAAANTERESTLGRVLEVGARGLAGMGLGIDVAEIDRRVAANLDRVQADTEDQIAALLTRAQTTMAAALDPQQRDSLISRILNDFDSVRDGFVAGIDPDHSDSHTFRFLQRLDGLFGPGGPLAQRLEAALDPNRDGSGMAHLSEVFERRFTELRDMLNQEKGRRDEADAGTRKGLDYEDQIELVIRKLAQPWQALVERTSLQTGELGAGAKVGDYLVVLPDGLRIVIEAKNTRSISVLGAEGILAELDRAKANRHADLAICVSACDAYPAEVGQFAVYGNRLLVVDDGQGVLLEVALRWAVETGRHRPEDRDIDVDFVEDRVQRIRQLAQLFSSNRRALSEIVSSVERVRTSIDGMRAELLDLTDDVTRSLRSTAPDPQLQRRAG